MAGILIVEDHPEVLQKLCCTFHRHDTMPARTVAEAKRILVEREPDIDLVLMDGEMGDADPEKDTIRLIQELRAAGFAKAIIGISPNPDMLDRQLEAGCTDAVHKFDLRVLVTIVNYHILLRGKYA